MQLTPIAACAACALLLTGMVDAQPPLPPKGVSIACARELAWMANTSKAPAPAVPCPGVPAGQTFCPTSVHCTDLPKGEICIECNTTYFPMPHDACPPYGMVQPWKVFEEHDKKNSPTKCIPNNSSSSPKPGVVCNSPTLDANMDYGNYVAACHTNHGNDMEKDIDLVWGPEYTCKDGAGKATPCLMHTELIACMPTDCTASDIALVVAMETKTLCKTLAPYNLSSCAVKYVGDNV